jgi:hypothetical protein
MAYQPHTLVDHETVLDARLIGEMEAGIAGAYFTTDTTLKLSSGQNQTNQVLSVNMATGDKRWLPITAAEVDTLVGNIDILLKTI